LNELKLNIPNLPFSLEHTLDSGQTFRWVQTGQWWEGVIQGGKVKVRQEGDALFCALGEGVKAQSLYDYFRFDDDLERVYSRIMKDSHVAEAVQRYYGLHLINQDVWECLVSFVIATNTNIPRIKLMISRLCERFGKKSAFEGKPFSHFPGPESLAGATQGELASCGLGYRARFVRSVAQKVRSGEVDLEELRFLDYGKARETLIESVLGRKSLLGIGRKAADCVLLFSCSKDESFPIDVWMARVLLRFYPTLFDAETASRLGTRVTNKTGLSGPTYDKISTAMRGYFGGYAGFAQQYLFHDARKSGLE